jgi:hypothetical protein
MGKHQALGVSFAQDADGFFHPVAESASEDHYDLGWFKRIGDDKQAAQCDQNQVQRDQRGYQD